MTDLTSLLHLQSGVLTRTQLLDHGHAAHDLRRLVRRRELSALGRGVYVDHTGPLTWTQRAWWAVLAVGGPTGGAALSHESALRVAGAARTDSDGGPIHVAVDRSRSPGRPTGVRLHHLADLEAKVVWSAAPPRLRLEEALIDVASEAPDEIDVVARLADAVQARLTTADRLLATLDGRTRIARRDLMRDALSDVAAGTCSALEFGYATRVERAHGLPTGARQVRDHRMGAAFRDVAYPRWGVVVELDGRAFHASATAHDHDLERDLDAVVAGGLPVRLGWGQVFGRGCDTAQKVGSVLQHRGWSGQVTACPRCAVSSTLSAAS